MSSDSITPEGFERILKDLFVEDESLTLDEAFAQVAVTRAYITQTQLQTSREELEKLRKDGKNFQLGELLMYLGHLNTTAFKQVLVCLNREIHYCEWCYQIYESAEISEETPSCSKCGGPTRSPGRRASTRVLFPKKPALPSPIPPPSKVYRLGKYLVRREIARGGMGVVYEANDPELKRTVALKVLRNVGASAEYIRRLHREASIGAQLQHPNIVRVYEVSMAEDAAGHQNHFIAMEYISGNTFADVLKETPRNISRLLEILLDVARGMYFAHKKGVIHRDLKPPNVLIEDTGRVVLTDFGLARAESLGSQMTRTWAVMGTPEYMAPEQVEGKTSEINERTDVYAIGVMLYEILAGATPFVAEVPATLYQKILHEDPTRPTKVNTEIPFDLELICLKAMNRDQDSRYEDMGEFLHDLQRYLKQEPIKARRSSFIYRIRKQITKRKKGVIATTAFLLLLGGLSIFGIGFLQQKEAGWEKDRDTRQEEFERKTDIADLERKEAREQTIRNLRNLMEDNLDAALAFRRAGKLQSMKKHVARAEAACRETIKREPDFAEAHYRLGRMYRVVMKNDKAREQQKLALLKDPDFAPALYERIVLTSWDYQLRVADLIKKAWQEAGARIIDENLTGDDIVLHIPSREELVQGDPETYAVKMQIRKDLLQLQNLIEKQPFIIREEEVTLAQGLYAWVNGNQDEAEKFLTSAINLNPYLEEGYETLAQLELNRGAFKDSIRWRTEGLKNDLGYLPHLENRGLARFSWAMAARDKGEDPIPHFRVAMKDFEKANELDPDRGPAWLNRALIHMHWGLYLHGRGINPTSYYEEGLIELEEASRRSPELVQIGLANGNILVHLGLYKQQKGQNPEKEYGETLAILDRVIQQHPDHFQGWSNRATVRYYWANYRASRSEDPTQYFKDAIVDYEKALSLNPALVRLWSDRGQTRLNWAAYRKHKGLDPRNLYMEAAKDFQQAIKMNSKLASSWFRLASVTGKLMTLQIQNGEDPEEMRKTTIARFNRALDLAPRNADCWAERASFVLEYALYLMSKNAPDTDTYFGYAINDYTKAFTFNPAIYVYLLKRCKVRLTRAQYLLAKKIDPTQTLNKALHDADSLVKKAPQWFQAWILRALTRTRAAINHARVGRDPTALFKLAIKDYEKALKIVPGHQSTIIIKGNTRVEWAKILLAQKKNPKQILEKALLDFREVEETDANMSNLWTARGTCKLYLADAKKKAGENPEPDYTSGIDDLDKAISNNPGRFALLLARGNGYYSWALYRSSRKKDGSIQMKNALSDIKKAVEINPALEKLKQTKIKSMEHYLEKHGGP